MKQLFQVSITNGIRDITRLVVSEGPEYAVHLATLSLTTQDRESLYYKGYRCEWHAVYDLPADKSKELLYGVANYPVKVSANLKPKLRYDM
jgi:hypothetical protein